jgi:hypothetical protein
MGVIFGGLPSGIAGRFMKVAAEADRRAIDTFGAALKGSGRSLVPEHLISRIADLLPWNRSTVQTHTYQAA